MNVREINKLLWDLELELSSGFKSWHDLEIALARKRELEKQLSEIISSPKPMKAKKTVKKAVVAKKKKAGECNCGIQELKKSIHSFSRKLIESVAEEIINLIPKYGDQYEIEAFRAEQRLKVKEIISEIGK